MAEEQNIVNSKEAQDLVRQYIVTSGEQSTFIRCTDEGEDSELDKLREVAEKTMDRQNDPEVKKLLDNVAKRLKEIYSSSVYCVHCNKLATLVENKDDKSLPAITFTCDCDDAKKEIADKKKILEEREILDKKYIKLQSNIINTKGLPLYKDHYKEIMKKRYAEFMQYDNSILNLTAIEDE